MSPDLAAEVAKVLAAHWYDATVDTCSCEEWELDRSMVAHFPHDQHAAHVAAEVTNALVAALEPLRTLAAEDWHWTAGNTMQRRLRTVLATIIPECPPNCERDHAPCSRNRWAEAIPEALGAGEVDRG